MTKGSESVVRSQGLPAVHDHFDLGSTTPLPSLNSVGVLALGLGKKMEVHVELLRLVFVIVNTKFVVVR